MCWSRTIVDRLIGLGLLRPIDLMPDGTPTSEGFATVAPIRNRCDTV